MIRFAKDARQESMRVKIGLILQGKQLAAGSHMIRLNSTECNNSLAETPLHHCGYTSSSVRNKRPLYAKSFVDVTSQSTTILGTLADFSMGRFPNNKKKPKPESLLEVTQEEKEEYLEALLNCSGPVNVEAFALVLTSTATQMQNTLARRAETWVKRLEGRLAQESQEQGANNNIEPILQCHAFVIQAWADSIGDEPVVAVNRASTWLEKAKTTSAQAPPAQIRALLTQCYNAYLDACSKGRGRKSAERKSAKVHAAKAEETLTSMVEQQKAFGAASPVAPNTESVNFVMRAIAHLKTDREVAERTERWLQLMEKSLEESDEVGGNDARVVIEPNPRSYSIWLNSIAALAQLKARNAHHKKGNTRDDGLFEIQALQDAVNHMASLYQKGRLGVFENNVPYNTLLTAWAGVSGKLNKVAAHLQAEKLFRSMVELGEGDIPEAAPDTTSYLQVIRAWASSGSDRAGVKAMWWLDKQWDEYEKSGGRTDLMPTTRTYIAAISAWGHCGNANEAEGLLLDFLRRYEDEHAPALTPNTEVFTVTIRAWLKAAESTEGSQEQQIERLSRAAEWLDSMVHAEGEGGPVTTHDMFLNVLKSATICAPDSPKVLDLAYRTFNTLRDSRHYVDPKAYAWLLESALLALAKAEHNEARTLFVTRLVKACCEDGLVSRTLILTLTRGPVVRAGWTNYESMRMTHELFPEWPLPPSWTRNLRRPDVMHPRPEDFQNRALPRR